MAEQHLAADGPAAQVEQEPVWKRGMIRIEGRRPVALITFDRAGKLNAMSRDFWPDLRAGLEWVERQEGLRAIVFTGAGDRAFSVGGDIGSFAALTSDESRHEFQVDAMATFAAVEQCSVTTIAAVNGLALGGGCEIAMACDFVVASEGAVFGLPEARFGLVPGYGVLRAPMLVGEQMAKMMVLAGERLTGEEALRCGLVQKLVPASALLDEALRLAERAAAASPGAVAAGKALMRKPVSPEAIARSVALISQLHGTAESRTAVQSFLKSSE
jgi:enoyl-CoA hydratase